MSTEFEIVTELYHIEKILFECLKKHGKYGRTFTLKIKYSDFEQITRSKTLPVELKSFNILHKTTKELLNQVQLSKKIRLIGLSVSQIVELENKPIQLTLEF